VLRAGFVLCLIAGCRLNFDDLAGDPSQTSEVALLAGATSVDVTVCTESAATIDWVLTRAAIDPSAMSVEPLLAGAEASEVALELGAHGCSRRTVTIAPNEATVSLLGVITPHTGAASSQITTQTLHPMFETRTFMNEDHNAESYVIHFPESYYRDPSAPVPMLAFTHGWGHSTNVGAGVVPIARLTTDSGFLEYFVERRPAVTDQPFAVIAPQCDGANYNCWGWTDVVRIVEYALDHAEANGLAIDPHRIYVTGISTGGEGAWRTAMDLERLPGHTNHHRVAAAVPTLSTYDPDAPAPGYLAANICSISTIPIWAFHCQEDSTQSVQNDQNMVDAVNACPGGGSATLSIGHWMFMGSTHAGFLEVYTDTHGFSRDGESSIYTWLLKQRR